LKTVRVSQHAIIRMRQRIRKGSEEELTALLLLALEKGTLYGESCIVGQRYLLYNGFVIHVCSDAENPEITVIRTTMTPDEARNAGGFRACT